MALSGNEIRQKFLDYFRQRGHKVVASSSIVPKDDPSLLFTNAGMVQFKRVFVGQEKRDYSRATTCQKCFRASGKHNDLENVGRTPRHHTFFEMLGNFSFGDYFKKEAVTYGWELLTQGFGLDPDKLWVSVHVSDDEAARLWESEVGLPPERIVRLGDEENFWAMGDTGPCGPCSEIHIDQGPEVGCGRPQCAVGCDCDRYLELWNLVFMQYERDASGEMTPLPAPSIDTGMGLERIAAVVQGKLSNYESDLFMPIIQSACQVAEVEFKQDPEIDVSLRVIADHARACTFLIADGILPSNEGRGYVLRRILRRAARHGRKLGLERPFLHLVAGTVMDQMQEAYPQLKDSRAFVDKVIQAEEERFGETLDTGLKILSEAVAETKAQGRGVLPGEVAFKLYDTYGFPLDLTMTIVEEEGLAVDEAGFQQAMEGQKSRSRAAWKGSGEEELPPALARLSAQGFVTEFTGYQGLDTLSRVELLLVEGQEVEQVEAGQRAELVTPQTPFYGQAGGQAGDTGWIKSPGGGRARVVDTQKPGGNIIVHQVEVTEGVIKKGDAVSLLVDGETRRATAANHTATHLLHAALRRVLGEHVKQAGSLVTAERLRFDFSHFQALTPQELQEVERIVNQGIRANIELCTTVTDMDQALASGAMALFEERYGEKVRLVEIPGLSKELCGGTHTRRTGDIGLFKIVSESSVAAGVRRVEALTGAQALEAVQQAEERLRRAAEALKTSPDQLDERAAKLLASLKEKERQVESLKARLAGAGSRDLLQDAQEIKGVKVLAVQVEVDNPKAMRELSDTLRQRIGSGVVVLGARAGDKKAMLLALVTDDLTDRIKAGQLVKELAPLVGGGGGGRPDLAQAGGQNPDGLAQALAKVPQLVEAALG